VVLVEVGNDRSIDRGIVVIMVVLSRYRWLVHPRQMGEITGWLALY